MSYLYSASIIGIDALPIEIEVAVSGGLPSFAITGLPDTSIKEARERIRSTLRTHNYPFPRTKVTVNLAPSDMKKTGSHYDLAIAIALLVNRGIIERQTIRNCVFIGELSLHGEIRPIKGALSIALMMREKGFTKLFLPKANSKEVSSMKEIQCFGAEHINDVVKHLIGEKKIEEEKTTTFHKARKVSGDFSHIKGQEYVKRGLEIAAAGGHNILLKGPPGTGKTLLAKSLPSILPQLTHNESLEVTSIASIAGVLKQESGLVKERPFYAPHHSCSAVSLIGGGSWPRPGAVSLAHRGVLFLDELPEFSRHVLEHLRQPLEDGEVVIARAAATMRFPAQFVLIAAMNPCPCGFATDPKRQCSCSPLALTKYQKKISGPLLDRFDLIIEVPPVESEKLLGEKPVETSSLIRARVENARNKQSERYKKTACETNAEISGDLIDKWCQLDEESTALLKTAIDNQQLSARGYARVRKVARTIADLAQEKTITLTHIAEALQFKTTDH